jgi:Ribonuclease G/E
VTRLAISMRRTLARIAVIEAGQLVDFALWDTAHPDGVGDLHAGRIRARVPALAGAFVDIGSAPDGFLPDSAGAKGLTEGDRLAIRVTRAAIGGKGPRLAATDAPLPPTTGLIAAGPGPAVELAERYPNTPIVLDDHALMARLRPALGERLRWTAHPFDAQIEDEIGVLFEPGFSLPNGARATITPTPALVAIDIDAGGASAARAPKALAQRALNEAIIPELARQIRLRNLGGAILVDFAGMPARARDTLGPTLTQALATDPLKPRLLGFTALGFAEILRPRIRPALHEFTHAQ